MAQVTGSEAGLTGWEQIRLALQEIIRRGGSAEMSDLYPAIEAALPRGMTLSQQGRDSLRNFINKVAVQAGYLYPHGRPWRITSQGREFARQAGS
jgi:hypothetical protein